MKVQVQINQVLRGLAAVQPRMRPRLLRGVSDVAWAVLAQAQTLCPLGGGEFSSHDKTPGALRDSATASQPVDDGRRISIMVGFHTIYAAVQHERLDFRHSQGQAKYLETALAAARDDRIEYLRLAMAKESK